MSSSTAHSQSALGRFTGALVAFIAPGAVVVGAAVLTASPGGEHVTAAEWIAAVVACIVASAAIEAQVSHRVRVNETERLLAVVKPPGETPDAATEQMRS